MEMSKDELESIIGGTAPQNFIFNCPYCKSSVEMELNSDIVTCLRCHRAVLDISKVKRKKGVLKNEN